ncbi:MAG: biotin/lipoyl-containing protein [Thermodesulfobacteriota bacterium]
MSDQIDYDEILGRYHSDPYEYVDIFAEHTGKVRFLVEEGSSVEAVSGEWKHIPGTPLYEITRERNPKKVTATTNGVVSFIAADREGSFVEAGEKLLTIRHPLKKKEIIESILKEVLYVFPAPERAKYFFSLDVQSRIEKKSAKEVLVKPGDEIIIMSLMKRDTPIYYSGEKGVIHSVYFKPGVSVEQGDPLIGVCPIDKLPLIQKIITRVKADWDKEGKE